MSVTATDERHMRRALTLARRGLGRTSPNPAVGAVLVYRGAVIGEGYHQRAGGPHAEIAALDDARKRLHRRQRRKQSRTSRLSSSSSLPPRLRSGPLASVQSRSGLPLGTTLYVTLEPCSTWGRTPPCTDAIIAAGIERVVIGATDPNPKNRGRGAQRLRQAGIEVHLGVLADDAVALNPAFNHWMRTGRPLVTAKVALSLDGKIATRTGDAKWITNGTARTVAHGLRLQVDAVMVGTNTLCRDNPWLTVRHGLGGRQPWRVVVDARGRGPLRSRVFTDAWRALTMVLTTDRAPVRWRNELARRGIEVVRVPARRGRVDTRVMLRALGRREITSLLVEGGGELLGSLFDARLVDRVVFFYAAKIIGGQQAVSPVAGRGVATVAGALRLRDCRWRRIDAETIVVEAECG